MISDDDLHKALKSWPTLTSLKSRLSVIHLVIEYWHGPIMHESSNDDDGLKGQWLPEALHWFYKTIGCQHKVHSHYNQLIKLAHLNVDNEGYIEFYRENQGVFVWATEPSIEDPPVFGRGSDTESWVLQMDRLSDFLLFVVIFEAIYQAPWTAHGSISRRAFAELTEPLFKVEVTHSLWQGEPCDIYHGRGLIVWRWRSDRHEALPVMLGALTESKIEYVKPLGNWIWNWGSDEKGDIIP